MALNFSHRHLLSAHLSEENLVSPMRIANGYLVEGISEKTRDMFSRNSCSNHGKRDCFDCGRDRGDRCGSHDSASVDILDLLPSDPFGMDISSTFTAITGWLEDLEVDYRRDDDGNNQLLAGLNFIWKNSMRFQEFPKGFDSGLGGDSCEKSTDESCQGPSVSSSSVDDGNDDDDDDESSPENTVVGEEENEACVNGEDEVLHQAFDYCLCYLGVKDLLSISMVCKSLQSTVHGDPLLWKHIHITQPLNEKITDQILLQLADNAQGNLHCLTLIDCSRITDEGLKRVIDSNPNIVKLSVPGCTRITIEGLLNTMRELKSAGILRVKRLRIGGLYGVTKEHYEELIRLLGIEDDRNLDRRNQRLYHRGGNLQVTCGEEDDAIDIEMCPKCQNFRLVYDCPAEGCKRNGHDPLWCRACTLCVQRCAECGRCITDSEYEETFCLEFLCSNCSNQIPKCLDRLAGNVRPSSRLLPPPRHCELSDSALG